MYTLNAGILANPGFVEQFATETTAAGKPAIAADIMAGWGSILPVGQFLANVLLPFLSARYGCKAAFAVCWTFLAANIIDEGQSRRWGHCLVAKLLAGIGLGCLRCTLPMYIAEVAPTRIRGTVLMTNNLWWTVGTFFAYLAMERLSQVDTHDWLTPAYSQWAQIKLMGIIFLILPESPASAITRQGLKSC